MRDELKLTSFEYALDFYKDWYRWTDSSARISYEESEDDRFEDIEDFQPSFIWSWIWKGITLDYQKRFLAQVDYIQPIDNNTEFEMIVIPAEKQIMMSF